MKIIKKIADYVGSPLLYLILASFVVTVAIFLETGNVVFLDDMIREFTMTQAWEPIRSIIADTLTTYSLMIIFAIFACLFHWFEGKFEEKTTELTLHLSEKNKEG